MAMNRSISRLLLGIMLIVGMRTGLSAQGQPATKSLYDRLGGVYSIATVVDELHRARARQRHDQCQSRHQ
jgi:hypothetical protein